MKRFFKLFGVVAMNGMMILANSGLVFAMDENVAIVDLIETVNMPEIYIKAINPGYTVDGVSNVGEMIEIARGEDSDELISLAGVTVRYTMSSGKEAVLLEFPENGFMAGEALLLRLVSSPGSELANLEYTKTLAMSGGLAILRDGEVLDEVCWTGKDGCVKAFNSKKPTTLVRNLETGSFEHMGEYETKYSAEGYIIKEDEEDDDTEEKTKEDEGLNNNDDEKSEEEDGELDDGEEDEKKTEGDEKTESDEDGRGAASGHCAGLQFSEILSYYAEAQSEQFVEIYNAGAEQILLDGCSLKYKNKLYELSGIVKPEGYFVRRADNFKLTKNPTNYNTIEIVDVNGTIVDKIDYPNGQKKGLSFAMLGYDESGVEIWHTTYLPTPGLENVYQEFKTCEDGKVINPETGNCVKPTEEVVEKICAAGQYLNPLTGRCKKIVTETEKVCAEGYYLNEATGRCRKIVKNDGAEYELETKAEREKQVSFVAVYAVMGVVVLGVIYVMYEYRKEILGFFKRLFGRK